MGIAWLYAGYPGLVKNGFAEKFEALSREYPPSSSDVSKVSRLKDATTTNTAVVAVEQKVDAISPLCGSNITTCIEYSLDQASIDWWVNGSFVAVFLLFLARREGRGQRRHKQAQKNKEFPPHDFLH